jgi:hypothetical protein
MTPWPLHFHSFSLLHSSAVSCWDCVAALIDEFVRSTGGMIVTWEDRGTRREPCTSAS